MAGLVGVAAAVAGFAVSAGAEATLAGFEEAAGAAAGLAGCGVLTGAGKGLAGPGVGFAGLMGAAPAAAGFAGVTAELMGFVGETDLPVRSGVGVFSIPFPFTFISFAFQSKRYSVQLGK